MWNLIRRQAGPESLNDPERKCPMVQHDVLQLVEYETIEKTVSDEDGESQTSKTNRFGVIAKRKAVRFQHPEIACSKFDSCFMVNP